MTTTKNVPAVILLGAATWPDWPALDNDAFRRSCEAFRGFLQVGLNVSDDLILDLFASLDAPNVLVGRIQEFLARPSVLDTPHVLVYYVGHGDRVTDTGDFALFTACASATAKDSSSFHVSYLAEALKEYGRQRPAFLLLDACFSGAATQSFKQPVGSAGVTILASTSSGDVSRTAAEATLTSFTDILLSMLKRGDSGLGDLLSLRTVHDWIREELTADQTTIGLPELHSPFQRRGDIAKIPVLPNGAHHPFDRSPDGTILRKWCTVVSEADGRTEPGVFADAVIGFHDYFKDEIKDTTGWSLQEQSTNVRASEVFTDPRSLREAVAAVCSADLAFFDLTGLEPAVMVLLGIRAVIRRGVTICTTGDEADNSNPKAPPFLLRDINVMRHGPGVDVPEQILGRRALAGIQELARAPFRYTDLPGFDTVRQLSPMHTDRTVIPYDETVLFLCPFNPDYNATTWPNVVRHLRGAIQRQRSQESDRSTSAGTDGPSADAVRIERTLDMGSPRIVSANLLEAIRLTDLCVVDITAWKPNVLFELGLRLAANPLDPVCVMAIGADDGDTSEPLDGQRSGLRRLLNVIDFAPDRRMDYYKLIDRFVATRDAARPPREPVPVGDRLAPGSIYQLAWRFADERHEPSAVGVIDLLRLSAAELSPSRSRGSTAFIFPKLHSLTAKARSNAAQRLLAAWLYLEHRYAGREDLSAEELKERLQVGYDLSNLLVDSEVEADRQYKIDLDNQLRRLDENRQDTP